MKLLITQITLRRCSNYIFILDLISGSNGLGKDDTRNILVLGFDATYIRGITVLQLVPYQLHQEEGKRFDLKPFMLALKKKKTPFTFNSLAIKFQTFLSLYLAYNKINIT